MLKKCLGHGLTKGAIILIFYHGLDESTQAILDKTTEGIFLYKIPNQAFQFLDGKVLFKLDWSTKSQIEHHQRSVAFIDGTTKEGGAITTTISSPVTAEEKIKKKNDVKAKKTRFGGNEATKKTQKTLLKQMYKNFSATSTKSQLVHEDLEQIHEDDLEEMDLKWQLALLSIRAKSYMAEDEVPTNMALMAFSDSKGTCPISLTSKNLKEDMLPLGEEQMEAELLKELLKL
nr:reverse transcriptase domain-containing protein [Tanacetum cinerariifolium]